MGGRAGGRGRPWILYRYVLREFALSFLISFLFFFVVFFVNQILLMAEDILSKKAELLDVLLLLIYAIPSEVAMSFPFASLVGALMATARLSADSEFLVMQASGLPPRNLFLPFAVLGLAVTLASFSINEYFLPLGSIQYGKLYRSLIVSSPAVELQPWSSRHYKDITIVTGAVADNAVEDVLIFDKVEGSRERVISARLARLRDGKDGSLVLELEGVWAQTLGKAGSGRVEYTSSSRMEYRLRTEAGQGASTVIGPFEMSSFDLGRVIGEKEAARQGRLFLRSLDLEASRSDLQATYGQAQGQGQGWQIAARRLATPLARLRDLALPLPEDRSIHIYQTEYYKKFAIPAGAICFVLLAYPIGLKARKAGRSVGFGLGLLISVVYWALLLLGSTMSSRLNLSPFWSMWGPNLLMLFAGLSLWTGEKLAR